MSRQQTTTLDLLDGAVTSAKILDATVATGDIADGAVTSAKIADGTIATADLANSAVTNAKLASDTARANLLTNGGLEIWQRGVGPFNVGQWGPDRWLLDRNGTSTLSAIRAATTDSPAGGQYMAELSYTHAAGGDGSFIYYGHEDWRALRGRPVSLSMRVIANIGGNVRLRMFDGVSQADSAIATAGVWQTLTVTLNVSASATLFNCRVFMNAATDTVRVDNAMLVVGAVPADYVPLHPADDLARCERYYEVLTDADVYITPLLLYSTNAYTGGLRMRVRKAVNPTVTITPTSQIQYGSGPGAVVVTPNVSSTTTTSINLNGSVAGAPFTAGSFGWLYLSGGGKIVAEANP